MDICSDQALFPFCESNQYVIKEGNICCVSDIYRSENKKTIYLERKGGVANDDDGQYYHEWPKNHCTCRQYHSPGCKAGMH
jgi:hypothetical protein